MKHRIQLDWSRLLGFDQVAGARRLEASRLAKCGAKPITISVAGSNLASKVGLKPNAPALGHRISAKVGSKPGFKPLP